MLIEREIKHGENHCPQGERIPTLEQGLLLTRDLDSKINIELKDHETEPRPFYLAAKILDCIQKTRIPLDNVVISSFNHGWLNWIQSQGLEIEIQALVGKIDDTSLAVNNPHEFTRFVNAGVDGIITDFPQEFFTQKRI